MGLLLLLHGCAAVAARARARPKTAMFLCRGARETVFLALFRTSPSRVIKQIEREPLLRTKARLTAGSWLRREARRMRSPVAVTAPHFT
jgi:hypothetical protein